MITGQATEQLVALRVNRDGRRESLPPKVLILPKWHDENELCGCLALIVEELIGITRRELWRALRRVKLGLDLRGAYCVGAGRLLCGCRGQSLEVRV